MPENPHNDGAIANRRDALGAAAQAAYASWSVGLPASLGLLALGMGSELNYRARSAGGP